MTRMIANTTNKIYVIRNGYLSATTHTALRRQLHRMKMKIAGAACSSTWAEDCVYRGAEYAPDFRCACERCRRRFPDRLHPREARQSDYSGDCQVEMSEIDPELAEDLAKLRNERVRIGSVFVK